MAKRMTGSQSRLLNVGERVRWRDDKNDQATVTETNWSGVTLKWDQSEPAIRNAQRHGSSRHRIREMIAMNNLKSSQLPLPEWRGLKS
jgi:hypothetical protein